MTLLRWQRPETPRWMPFQQLSGLREEIDRLFESPLMPLAGAQPFFGGWCPAIDLYEDKDNITFRCELPGMKKDEIEISLQEGVLTVSGERKLDAKLENAETHRSERFTGRFQRSVTLPAPVDADKIKATYKDGILTVLLPKAAEARPKQIQVKGD
jgi:HSP20 family protein